MVVEEDEDCVDEKLQKVRRTASTTQCKRWWRRRRPMTTSPAKVKR